MAPRANWRGYLKVGELTCSVGIYTAASTSDRIAFHTINRKTGNRVRREFVDSKSGKPVESEDQVKGYAVDSGEFIILEPDEIAAAVPDSDKTLSVDAFIPCREVDDVYFDKPYWIAPTDAQSEEAYALIRKGMEAKNVAALARTVLFRRLRTVLIRPHDEGLIGTTLNFDYEVRSAREAFSEIGEHKTNGEMLELAQHIINTKSGKFDPARFEDRYEAALAELVKAKAQGKTISAPKQKEPGKVVDLMEALRKSAGQSSSKAKGSKAKAGSKAGSAGKAPARKKAS